jgi:hypothetical protein
MAHTEDEQIASSPSLSDVKYFSERLLHLCITLLHASGTFKRDVSSPCMVHGFLVWKLHGFLVAELQKSHTEAKALKS